LSDQTFWTSIILNSIPPVNWIDNLAYEKNINTDAINNNAQPPSQILAFAMIENGLIEDINKKMNKDSYDVDS
jgi:hypothetical protein